MLSYNDDFYRLLARLDVQEEEKLFVLKYVNGLSPHIQQEMEFLTISMLADAFHYASKLEAKNIIIASLKMSTSVHCWWENLSIKMEKDEDPIDTWVKFVEYV